MVDLMKFCGATGDDRVGSPWSEGEFTLATNGHILIRVPRMDDFEEKTGNLNLETILRTLDKEPIWVHAPVVPVTINPCPRCSGTGKVDTCPECWGSGKVEFENDYNEYKCTCESCDGHGTLKTSLLASKSDCQKCEGTGKDLEHTPVNVNGVLISDLYLSWIAALPNAEIGTFGPDEVVRFRFDGGDGFVMPRRA